MFETQWHRFSKRLMRFSANQAISGVFSQREEMIVASSLFFIMVGWLWGCMYLFSALPLASVIPFSYGVILSAAFAVFLRQRNQGFFLGVHHSLTLLLPFMLHMMLGGFINSSAVILWSFTSPLSALVLNTRKSALNWFAGFLALLVMSAAYDPFITQSAHFQDVFIRVMFVLNMGGVLSIAFILLFYYVNLQRKALRASEESGARSDRLLKNMLPPRVAHVLKSKSNPGMIAEAYPEATVMFADLSGFTTLSGSMSAKELVEMLDGLYSYFDELVERHGIEKIRTIGDNYMVAAGVPEARDDHAEAIATMALDIKDYCLSLDMINGRDILFKMGMHSGPVIGGVVGKKNLHFDIWGDTVNTASRMETHGLPGMIQVTETTYKLLKARFALEPRGVIDVKSKGQMRTWFLMGRK